jgi:hypothetical protein
MAVKLNSAGGGSVTLDAESTASNVTQTMAGVDGTLAPIVSGTAQASTSGTAINFTGIPSWVKRITVMFSGVSTNGTAPLQVQLGAGSYTTSGYSSTAFNYNSGTQTDSTVGLILAQTGTAADSYYGNIVITNITGSTWTSNGIVKRNTVCISVGGVALSGTLDRLRIIGSTTGSPVDTFDAGSINILYE